MREQLLHLLFPNVCLVCKEMLMPGEEFCCSACMDDFDPFGTPALAEQQLRSVILDHFGSSFQLERGWCRYQFHKQSPLQQVLHAMKYEGLFHLGSRFGRQLGSWMLAGADLSSVDCIVPVPLHRLKKIERSYNQAEKIALGLAQTLKKPVRSTLLVRQRFTVSQTGLSVSERVQNASGAFMATSEAAGAHVLLVDDVITTGSTMVAAAQALRQAGAAGVFLAAVALAVKE